MYNFVDLPHQERMYSGLILVFAMSAVVACVLNATGKSSEHEPEPEKLFSTLKSAGHTVEDDKRHYSIQVKCRDLLQPGLTDINPAVKVYKRLAGSPTFDFVGQTEHIMAGGISPNFTTKVDLFCTKAYFLKFEVWDLHSNGVRHPPPNKLIGYGLMAVKDIQGKGDKSIELVLTSSNDERIHKLTKKNSRLNLTFHRSAVDQSESFHQETNPPLRCDGKETFDIELELGISNDLSMDIGSQSDPYVQVYMQEDGKWPKKPIMTTEVIKDATDCTFEKKCIIKNVVRGTDIRFKVMDKDFLKADDLVGSVTTNLSSLLKTAHLKGESNEQYVYLRHSKPAINRKLFKKHTALIVTSTVIQRNVS